MSTISTHVLDAVTGQPAAGIAVTLVDIEGTPITEGTTDADGRIGDLVLSALVGVYRLHFDVDAYFGGDTFYPEVVVVFRITDADADCHVPVLLSPYAYSTYRGS